MKTQKNVLGLLSSINFYFLSAVFDPSRIITFLFKLCFASEAKFFKEKGINMFNLASLCHRQEGINYKVK